MVRMQLHEDKGVVFAGYRIPHPLESKMVVMVKVGAHHDRLIPLIQPTFSVPSCLQTNGTKSPPQAIEHALDDLRSEWTSIQNQFDEEARRVGGTPVMHY